MILIGISTSSQSALIGVTYLDSSKHFKFIDTFGGPTLHSMTLHKQCATFFLLPQSRFSLPCSISPSLVLLNYVANCSFCLFFCSVYLADLFLLRLFVERTRGLYFTFSTVTSSDYSMPPAVRKWCFFHDFCLSLSLFLTGYACQTHHLQHFLAAASWGSSSVDRAESLTFQKFVLNSYISVKVNYILLIFIQHILITTSFTDMI